MILPVTVGFVQVYVTPDEGIMFPLPFTGAIVNDDAEHIDSDKSAT